MLANYSCYCRMKFTAVKTCIEENWCQKENKIFLLDKSHKFKNYFKVNIIKQQKAVLIQIANDIEKRQP